MTFKMYYLENIPLLLKTGAPCTAHGTGRLTTGGSAEPASVTVPLCLFFRAVSPLQLPGLCSG